MYFLFHNLFALSIFLFSPSAEFFISTQNCSFLETLCGSFQIFLIVCIPCWCFKLIFYLVKHIKHIYFLFSIWYLFSIFSLWGSHSVLLHVGSLKADIEIEFELQNISRESIPVRSREMKSYCCAGYMWTSADKIKDWGQIPSIGVD